VTGRRASPSGPGRNNIEWGRASKARWALFFEAVEAEGTGGRGSCPQSLPGGSCGPGCGGGGRGSILRGPDRPWWG